MREASLVTSFRAPHPQEDDDVLWDLMHEHLDEAEYAYEALEAQLDHATLTLQQVEQGIEARLDAQVDALLVGGEEVTQRLLRSVFADSIVEPARITAAALALVRGDQPRLVGDGLLHADPRVRRATQRGILLGGATRIQRWAIDRFRETRAPEISAVLLPLIAGRLEPATLLACLRSDHPALITAAAHAAARGEPGVFAASMEQLLAHEVADVRRVAMRAALAWGSTRAWTTLATAARNGEELPLFAALSRGERHTLLQDLLAQGALRRDVLFALGFTGNPRLVPRLLEYVGSGDELEAKLAAQSIWLITGLDILDDAYCVPPPQAQDRAELPPLEEDAEARAALPPLEDDDLDADLVPAPEAALPTPDPDALRRSWAQAAASFQEDQRYLLGKPLNVATLLDALEHSRMRVRHVIAESLAARTSGRYWIDTRDRCAHQRQRLQRLRAGLKRIPLHPNSATPPSEPCGPSRTARRMQPSATGPATRTESITGSSRSKRHSTSR